MMDKKIICHLEGSEYYRAMYMYNGFVTGEKRRVLEGNESACIQRREFYADGKFLGEEMKVYWEDRLSVHLLIVREEDGKYSVYEVDLDGEAETT